MTLAPSYRITNGKLARVYVEHADIQQKFIYMTRISNNRRASIYSVFKSIKRCKLTNSKAKIENKH